MVLVSGQRGQAQVGVRFDHHLAHRSGPRAPPGRAVEQAESVGFDAVGADEAGPEDLEAGADRQYRRPLVNGPAEGPAGRRSQLPGGQRLREILATADHVDLARLGHRISRSDGDHPGLETPPGQPASQDDGVAGVAVGAEQVRKEEGDGDRPSRVELTRTVS